MEVGETIALMLSSITIIMAGDGTILTGDGQILFGAGTTGVGILGAGPEAMDGDGTTLGDGIDGTVGTTGAGPEAMDGTDSMVQAGIMDMAITDLDMATQEILETDITHAITQEEDTTIHHHPQTVA